MENNLEEQINRLLPATVASFKRTYGSISVLDSDDFELSEISEESLFPLKRTSEILKLPIDLSEFYLIPRLSVLIYQCYWALFRNKSEIINSDCTDYMHFQKALDALSGLRLLNVRRLGRAVIALNFSERHSLVMYGYPDQANDDMCVFELEHGSRRVAYSQNCGFHETETNWIRLFHTRIINEH